MAYLTVESFSAGMDRRRERVAGAPGTLWLGKNIHITRGGDIERRKKFVDEYDVTGTFGVASLRSQLYTFGSDDLSASMPNGVLYQRLVAPSSPDMTAILDVKSFDGKLYVIAEYQNGQVYHFYDGSRVTEWDTVGESGATVEGLAALMALKIGANAAVTTAHYGSTVTITANVPGTEFLIAQLVSDDVTIDATITLVEEQANVAGVTEVRASADVTITAGATGSISAVRVNGVDLLTSDIDWASTNSATAIRLATAITNGYSTHGYTASALNDTVTIEAALGTGATPNTYPVDVVTHGDVAVTADGAMAGGVTEVEAVAQIYSATFGGTFEIEDTYLIVVNSEEYRATGLASGMGRSLYVDKNRVWSPVGSLWRYCDLDDATNWTTGNSGFINIANESEGNEQIVVAARYQNLAAIFSGTDIILFTLDVDPTNFAFSNILENTGTFAAGAPVRYGNNDVFYLDQSGIRSLRARDASNAAFVSDVGNAIDTFVLEYLESLTREQVSDAIGAIEPRDGRYWLIVGTRIFVLSFFPGGKISAWSYYDTEEFGDDPVQATARVRDRIFVRAGDSIYVYGGLDGTEYPDDDEAVAEVQTPFLSGNTPATIKKLTGFDFAGTNTWECEVAYDPNASDRTINVGRLERITYADPNKISLPGETSMVSLALTCRTAGAATISMATVHYEGDEAG